MRLTVPPVEHRPDSQVITNPAVLVEWLDHLPNIDLEGMVARVTRALAGLNRHPESLIQLPALLRSFQGTFDEPFDHFVKGRGLRGETGGGRRTAAILSGFLEFNRELAFGYGRLLNDWGEKLGQEAFADAVTLAMQCQERDILFAYERYQRSAPAARGELYQLYLMAEERGVASQVVESGEASPVHVLNRVLLLGLADPFCLPQQGLWAAQSYLVKHAAMATLTQEEGTGVLVDIQSGTAPRGGEGNPPPDSTRYRYLDTRLLCEATRRYVSGAVRDATKLPRSLGHLDQIMAMQLLRQWHRNWSSLPLREVQRQESSHRILMACGLKAIHHYLQKGNLTEEETGPDSLEDEVILEGHAIYQSSRVQEQFPLHEWRLFDLSEKGAGMRKADGDVACFQVGQLVVMSEENPGDEPRPWVVGLIRRRVDEGRSKCEIGVEFLRGQLHSLEMKPLITEASDPTGFSPALIIEQKDSPALLVAPHGLFKLNRAFTLRRNDQSRRVRAAVLGESTRYLDLFTFTVN